MNLPNKLTVLRILLVPFFVASLLIPFPHHYLASCLLFVMACKKKKPGDGFRKVCRSIGG